jgi:hypothetical protein
VRSAGKWIVERYHVAADFDLFQSGGYCHLASSPDEQACDRLEQ